MQNIKNKRFAKVGSAKLTRFPELGYVRIGSGWRILNVAGHVGSIENAPVVGKQYRTERELLADVDRFAAVYGCH